MVRIACALLLATLVPTPAGGEPYPGWHPHYWAKRGEGVVVLWDPWPFAGEIRSLEYGEAFDFPPTNDDGEKLVYQNGYIQIVTQDGEVGWIPATSGITAACGRPPYRIPAERDLGSVGSD
jgi:hypothetical protein